MKAADPQAPARRAAITAAQAAHPDALEFDADECDVLTLPLIRGQYQRRGQQGVVPTPGTRRKQGIFGFLNVRTGDWHYWLTARKRSREFLACLHELLALYPGRMLLLCVDNASIHKSKVTRRFLANHPRLVVCYLPTYSGHRENPVEKVWWALKETIAANYLRPSLEALQDAIHGFFAQRTAADLLWLTHRRAAAATISIRPPDALALAA